MEASDVAESRTSGLCARRTPALAMPTIARRRPRRLRCAKVGGKLSQLSPSSEVRSYSISHSTLLVEIKSSQSLQLDTLYGPGSATSKYSPDAATEMCKSQGLECGIQRE